MAEPLCKYFGICNGCSLQHLDYETQINKKKDILAGTLGFKDVNVLYDAPYSYRNRLDVVFHEKGIGLRGKNANSAIDVEKCAICNEKLNEIIKEMREFFKEVDYFNKNKHSGTFCYAILRATDSLSSVSFLLNEKSSRLKEAIEQIKEFAEKTGAYSITVSYINPFDGEMSNFFILKGMGMLKENFMGKEFSYSTEGFFQNNSKVAEKMQEYCNKIFRQYDTKDACLLDLYGGVGTFGIINSELFKEVIIVESDKNCIESAEMNIKNNQIKNAKAIRLDAKNLDRLKISRALFVIADPPRSGMDMKTIKEIVRLKPHSVLYISCNTEQLGKDIKKFDGYKIKTAGLFDLFPQTPHIEAIVELSLCQEHLTKTPQFSVESCS